MRVLLHITFCACLLAPSLAVADDYSNAIDALCQKMKTCALQSMGEVDDMPAKTREMITASLNSMCEGMQQQYDVAMQRHALYQPATDCISSMAALTCEELEAAEDDVTPQCVAFREQADKYQ